MKPQEKPQQDDTDLEPLPPLDGDTDEPEPDLAADELDDDDLPPGSTEAAGDPFDDTTGEDDPAPDIDEEEQSWLTDAEPVAAAADAADFDLSDLPDAGGTLLSPDVEEPGVGDEDFGLGDGENDQGLDAGEEGPTDADEEMREEDLPALDADDEEDLDGSTLFELPLDEEPETPLAWDRAPWQRAGAPFDVGPVVALACGARDVLGLAEADGGDAHVLVRLDLEGAAARLPAQGAPRRPETLVVQGREIWLEQDGRRWLSTDDGATFAPATGEAERARASALAQGEEARASADVPVVPEARVVSAARGPAGAVLAAVVGAKNGRTWLTRFEGDQGTVVAEISGVGSPEECEVRALVWDEARAVAWVSGTFGVLAFQPPPAVLRPADAGA